MIMGHSGGLASMEVSGHSLVTSGYIPAQNGNMMIEPLIKLWDLRMNRVVDSFAHAQGATFIKFQPKCEGHIVVVSQLGAMFTLDTKRGGMVVDETQVM
jgi:PAB-dependent poly(A)-specific ribonuclease subunit 2